MDDNINGYESVMSKGQGENIMKRITILIVTCLLILTTFGGCTRTEAQTEDRFIIVTTIFPSYDWVRQILGDNVDNFNLSFLTDSGVDLHSYQPTVRDIALIASSDIFIYVGGKSDGWVTSVLNEAVNPNMIVINLMDVLGTAMMMENDHHHHDCDHHDCNHHHHHDCDHHDCNHHHHHCCDHHDCNHHHHHDCNHHHHFTHEDEHIWLSLNFAKILSTAITEALIQLDPNNAYLYQTNLNAYIGELSVLGERYQTMIDSATVTTLLFADRFPFRYLMDDFGLTYYAAFPGCSAETEASFSTIAFLIGRVNDLGLTSIFVTESSDESLARTIARDSLMNPQILVLDSMQSVTARDVQSGITYLSIMENNLNILRETLN